jgi:hypothetical protein
MRVWGKTRVGLLRSWLLAECSHVFAMRPGRRCLDGVYRELLRGLLAVGQGKSVVEIHMDISKFFDRVGRDKLVEMAGTLGFPLRVLQVSVATYTGPRYMVTSDNVAVGPIYSRHGVPAGSPHAIFEVALYMLSAIRYLENLYPSVCWSLFVDDLAIKVTHDTPNTAAIVAVHATGAAIHCIRDELGLPLDWKKTNIIGSCQVVVDKVSRCMAEKAGGQATATSVRKLGGECSYSHRRRPVLKVFRGRVKRALARYRVIQRLADKQPHPQIFRAGPQQEALYGGQLVIPDPRLIAQLRQAAVRAARMQVPGSDPHLRHLFLRIENDPLYDLQVRIVDAWAREWWAAEGGVSPPDGLTEHELTALFHQRYPSDNNEIAYRLQIKDPLATLQLALARWRWTWTAPAVWTTPQGMALDLRYGPPALLRRWCREAHTRILCALAVPKVAPEAWYPVHLVNLIRSRSRRALTLPQQRGLLAYLSGTVLTRVQLRNWGYRVAVTCPFCGAGDTAEHRVWDCPATDGPDRAKALAMQPTALERARCISDIPAPDIMCFEDVVHGYVHGVGSTDQDAVVWDPCQPVYTDGSVHNGTGLLG